MNKKDKDTSRLKKKSGIVKNYDIIEEVEKVIKEEAEGEKRDSGVPVYNITHVYTREDAGKLRENFSRDELPVRYRELAYPTVLAPKGLTKKRFNGRVLIVLLIILAITTAIVIIAFLP